MQNTEVEQTLTSVNVLEFVFEMHLVAFKQKCQHVIKKF